MFTKKILENFIEFIYILDTIMQACWILSRLFFKRFGPNISLTKQYSKWLSRLVPYFVLSRSQTQVFSISFAIYTHKLQLFAFIQVKGDIDALFFYLPRSQAMAWEWGS